MATPPPSARCAPSARATALSNESSPPPLAVTDAPEMTPSVVDKKRLKHREYVKKSYNKKISTIEALKTELEALEKQYSALLTAKSAAGASDSALQQQSPLLHKYMQLTDVKRRLRHENDTLYQTNASRMKTEGRMHQLLHTDAQLPRVATPYRIRPLPDAEYAKVIVDARDDILRFMRAPGKLSSGASVFGWTDQRKVQGDALKFALEKTFANISAHDLLERSWRIFSSPTEFPKIYSQALHVEFHELQRVNADTVLFYRTIRADGSSVVVKTVFLLARVKIDEGYMLLFRSIDRSRVAFAEDPIHAVLAETQELAAALAAPLGTRTGDLVDSSSATARRDVWVDKYIWVIFKDRGPASCVFHFGGSTSTAIWLKEVLFIALKWETMAVGPPITLTMG